MVQIVYKIDFEDLGVVCHSRRHNVAPKAPQ